ncbi:hypothetical protein [Dyadobacter bucti]|uniref:hypothetical protein n=1 Tax=Dyadobacter bucti TaxID=2572203 RepID=UPI0011095417|nr:hypothetical protein [Dyadobacter bucti]
MKEEPIGSNSSVKVCKLVMLVILLFYSCNQDYSNETHVVLPDKRLLFIIDQYVKMDTAFTDTRLITLTQLNSRSCQTDYYLSSVGFLLKDLYDRIPPSKYFEYKGMLCIVLDGSDALYSSKNSKKEFQKLVKKHQIPVADIFEGGSYSRSCWYVKYFNDSITFEKECKDKEYPCDTVPTTLMLP